MLAEAMRCTAFQARERTLISSPKVLRSFNGFKAGVCHKCICIFHDYIGSRIKDRLEEGRLLGGGPAIRPLQYN